MSAMPNPAPGFRKRPDHRIHIEPAAGRVVVTFAGQRVADSRRALLMQESGYPPVHYIPEADLDTALMRPSARRTHCPFKGDARYRTLSVGARTAEDAVWSYPAPFDECAAIAGHAAFYADRVDAIEVLP